MTQVQTLYCTTEIGSERPIHKCGNAMSKCRVLKSGRQQWRCERRSCNEALSRYKKSEKGLERVREAGRRHWYSGRGYLAHRRRRLSKSRARIVEQLNALKEAS